MILAKVKLFVFLSDPTNDHSLILAQRAGEQPTVDEFGACTLRAPELILRSDLGPQVDIWALGCLVVSFLRLCFLLLLHPKRERTGRSRKTILRRCWSSPENVLARLCLSVLSVDLSILTNKVSSRLEYVLSHRTHILV
jgi:serine/threonine protein kinase